MDSEIDYFNFSPLVWDEQIKTTQPENLNVLDLNDLGIEFPLSYEETLQDVRMISECKDLEADLSDLNEIIKEVTSEIPTSDLDSFEIPADFGDFPNDMNSLLEAVSSEISAINDDSFEMTAELVEFSIDINELLNEVSSEIPVTPVESYEITEDLDSIISNVLPPSSTKKKPLKRLGCQKTSNKEAVVKYRSKKQKKKEDLFKECEEYSRKNSELKNKIQDIQSEISLIKTLLVEALMAKK